MPNTTDPAKDLATIYKTLSVKNSKRGDDHLAEIFGVPAWSKDFYQILFCVSERAEFLIQIVQTLEMDDDIKTDAIRSIKTTQKAFHRESLASRWDHQGSSFLTPEHVRPILMLSPLVREKVSYPQLSKEEIEELVNLLDQLESWLQDHQLNDKDFIRQAIIDGLQQFRFRLKHVGWFGWGYTIESLKEVISAYMVLNGAIPDPSQNPTADAILKKVSSFVHTFYEKTTLLKEVSELGDFMLRAYGAAMLALHGPQGVAGLLTYNP